MELTIEKLVFGGQGLAKKDGKTCLVWNALPLEAVQARIVKKTHSIYEAVADEILQPSPERIAAAETHYLSCGPWQIVKWDAENEWKRKIAAETYERIGGLKEIPHPSILSDPSKQFGYRNKIEYGFSRSGSGLSFAFFERDTHSKFAIEPCLLAEDSINRSALHILAWLKKEGIPERCLKSLVVRSDNNGRTIAGLFITEALGIKTHPALNDFLAGFHIYYSEKLIHGAGEKRLTALLNGIPLKFGLFSFFQINAPVFEKTLEDMAFYLDPSKKLVDFYSGVGAIGIGLKGRYKSAVLVDSHPEAIAYAKENIELNGLKNCEAVLSSAEKMTRLIESDSILVFDPPRAGLDPKVLRKILSEKPARILYLSCDVATHARDIKILSSRYELKGLKLYNFFPRTPHIESLAVLDRI